MTAPLSANAFDGASPQTLQRFAHARFAPHPGQERAVGLAVTVGAHIVVAAGLVLGLQVAKPLLAAKPIMVDVIKSVDKPNEKPAPLPKLAAPSLITAPMPVIEIAPAPTAIAASPPKSVAPPVAATPAPAQKATGDGRASYAATLLAYLERFKRYPAEARAAHIEGAVLVHFVMRRDGHVLSREIAKSSGRPVLDREALAMIDRAGTVPPLPADMPGDTLDAVIGPIHFSLH